jgi:hypothetical protein
MGRSDRNADVKRTFLFLVVVFVVGASAFAALPAALILINEAAVALGGVVLRQAGKEVVVTLGTAANDATWATAATVGGSSGSSIGANILAFLGLGVLSGSAGDEKYQIPLKANVVLPRAPLTGMGSGVQSPLLPVVRFGPFSTSSDNYVSNAGPVVTFTVNRAMTGDELIAAYSVWKNSCVTEGPCEAGITYHNFRLEAQTDTYQNVTYGGTTYVFNKARIWFEVKWPQNTFFNTESSRTLFVPVLAEPLDGVKRFRFVNEKWSPDPADPDWMPDELTGTSASRIAVRGQNELGQDVRVDVSLDAAKQVQINALTQVEPDKVMHRSITLNASLQPSQASQTVTSSANVSSFYETYPEASPSTGSQSVTVQFPDDYARQPTLQNIDSNSTAIKEALTQAVAAPTLTDNGDDLSQSLSWGDTFTDIVAWRLPSHTSTCPVLDYAQVIGGYDLHVHMDQHCTLIEEHLRAPLEVVMAIVWLLAGFFIVMEA